MGIEPNNLTVARAYALWAPFYDLVFDEVFKRARSAAIAAAEDIGGNILEVGVGTGLSLPSYGRENRLVGVDLSEPMLRKAQERSHELGLRHVEGLAVMDAAQMAFADESFDVIVAQLVVTTVPDPEGTLDEFLRVLKPGGEIVLVSRVGADKGIRLAVERALTPLTSLMGWRLEFPFDRYLRWVERTPNVNVLENRAMPPFGHFSLIRFGKSFPAIAQQEPHMGVHAGM
ncbi:MAG TPA: class I SAM-dependent methyltransferase [Methylocella sp.]|nr:class I SAM-dependent methyltransferase [Methylocella sp.]